MPKKIPLYETLINDIIHQIDNGIYKPGDKIPSIRRMSKLKKVSINTVKEAYMILENRRIIHSKPQSGYFIRYQWPEQTNFTNVNKKEINPIAATTNELIHMVLQDAMKRDFVQLGCVELNPDLLPVKQLNQILASQIRIYQKDSVACSNAKGLEKLRVQIARRYADIGCHFGPEDIYITSSCMEGIFLSLITICKPGDTIIVEHPILPITLLIWEKLGLKIIEVPTSPETGICLDTLDYVLNNKKIAACVLVPNFNNPLGSLMPPDKKKTLVEMLEKHDVPVIEDDVFGDLSFTPERPDVLKCYDTTGNVVTTSSFSKSLAPGYKTGFIIPGKFKTQFEQIKLSLNSCTATPSQLAIAAFLDNGNFDRYLRRICRVYATNMAKIAESIIKYFPPYTR
ncbi:MAG: PLP-dependent aminotransferase family protein, partial [Spirochaetes bacterium]|nr:PLP-dependent aminotransferase family protein [Spirochaetota bacterium]